MNSKLTYFFLLCSFITVQKAWSQQPVSPTADTIKKVEILDAKKLELLKINDTTQLQVLTGHVKLRQANTLFYCDSCIINNSTHIFEAFGHVHINDGDTANAFSDYLRYLTDKRIAYLQKNVRLTDGKATLTTDNLEYDVDTKLGIYTNGGKVVNRTSVLTSLEGYYYTDLKDIYFKKNVQLKDPAYSLRSDSLLYNTQSEVATFIAETFIRDSSNRTIITKDGHYDTKNKKAEFGRRPIVQDGKTKIIADRVAFDDSTGMSDAEGNAIVVDSTNQTVIIAGKIFRNNKNESMLAFNKPLMIVKQDEDSIYISADTLFSARLSDLYRYQDSIKKNLLKILNHADSLQKDSLKITHRLDSLPKDSSGNFKLIDSTQKDSSKAVGRVDSTRRESSKTVPSSGLAQKNSSGTITSVDSTQKDFVKNPITTDSANKVIVKTLNPDEIKKGDSTDRYFEAFYHVRIFSDSVQSVCDSLFYSFKDSVFRLFKDPIVWSKESQVTGDTILLFTKNRKADRIKVFENSLLVNKVLGDFFNQIKSERMDGYLTDGSMDSVRAKGFAECIYYIQNEDSSFTGVNQSNSDLIDVYFSADSTGEKGIQRVVFRSAVKGTLWPMRAKTPEELRLQNFKWLDNRRPKTKYELYE